MRFTATSRTAAAAGAWLGVGASVFERFNLVGPAWFAVEAVTFFFVPVAIWVIGLDHIRKHWSYQFSRQYWARDFPQELVRAICWFVGAAISGFACSYLLYGRWPVSGS
jgi:hypothetical protein